VRRSNEKTPTSFTFRRKAGKLVSSNESPAPWERFPFGGRAINARSALAADMASIWEPPPPILLNTWKHHAAALRWRIRETVAAGPAALDELASNLLVIGTELMDLYLGELSPREIGERLLAQLHSDNHLSLDIYRVWIQANRGYRLLALPEDNSQWVLRLGDEAKRYVHIHPARWAPRTCRVNANGLKTAVMILAYTGIHGSDPLDVALVNLVRRDYLGLEPLGRALVGNQGIGQAINLLRNRAGD
jgi:hypothetical protein